MAPVMPVGGWAESESQPASQRSAVSLIMSHRRRYGSVVKAVLVGLGSVSFLCMQASAFSIGGVVRIGGTGLRPPIRLLGGTGRVSRTGRSIMSCRDGREESQSEDDTPDKGGERTWSFGGGEEQERSMMENEEGGGKRRTREGGVKNMRKRIAQMEEDPKERAIIERQKVLAAAMDLLQRWDEEQFEFVQSSTDRNAPLGDWRGLRRQLTMAEREEMRRACRTLADDARYVCLGLNAESEEICVRSMHEWLDGLGLPKPEGGIVLTDDASAFEFKSKDEMPRDIRNAFTGPMHIGYNSKAGADPVTGDDTNAPAAASMMPYPAPDRGVVFTPILEGFFTQYGDVPLDLFAPDDEVEARRAAGEVASAYDPDVVLKQHAALGNEQAIKELLKKQEQQQRNMGAGEPQGF